MRQAPIREQVLTPLAECELQQHVEDLKSCCVWRCAFRRPGRKWDRLGSGGRWNKHFPAAGQTH